jgi:hypothetical protein
VTPATHRPDAAWYRRSDRLLADVVPSQATDDLLWSGPAVGECGDEGAVSEVSELDADSFDVLREEDVRLAGALVARLGDAGRRLYSMSSSLTASDRIDCTIVIALTIVAVPTPHFSSSARNRVRRLA